MTYQPKSSYQIALEDFHRARRQAATSEILRRLRGQPTKLLPFDLVQQYVEREETLQHELERIPLKAIVGSVGRYTDFTRDFLPRSSALRKRWARVRSTFKNLENMPPINVYQIGGVYFVLDGNHRVSNVRERGATDIRAYVTKLQSDIDITPETDLDGLILKVEMKNFLTRTQLDKIEHPPDLSITTPGKYQVLEHQIEQFKTQLEDGQKQIPFPEAAKLWYQHIYQPAIEIIQDHDLLHDFPNRTNTDLFIWISQHQDELNESLGWEIDPEDAAADLADQFSTRPDKVLARWRERIRDRITPTPIGTGPKTGQWRRAQIGAERRDRLFSRILVALSGDQASFQALEQALYFADREQANLLGLHVVKDRSLLEQPETLAIQNHFDNLRREADVRGKFAIEVGSVTPTICERARWSDLVVVHLAHPPRPQGIQMLAPGFHRLIQCCPRPMLVVPRSVESIDNLLLAYDGSSRANEALFIAAYLADKWKLPMTVLIVLDEELFPKKAVARARWYLHTHNVLGDIHFRYGEAAKMIIDTAENGNFSLIIMGGYSHSPVLESVIGSTLNTVLQSAKRPILICR